MSQQMQVPAWWVFYKVLGVDLFCSFKTPTSAFTETSATMTLQPSYPLSAMVPQTSRASVNYAPIKDVPLLPNGWPFPDLKGATAFDVDPRTGFMASQPPLSRLPAPWDVWELMLDNAIHAKLRPGDKLDITEDEKNGSERWRVCVRNVRFDVLPGAGRPTSI